MSLVKYFLLNRNLRCLPHAYHHSAESVRKCSSILCDFQRLLCVGTKVSQESSHVGQEVKSWNVEEYNSRGAGKGRQQEKHSQRYRY